MRTWRRGRSRSDRRRRPLSPIFATWTIGDYVVHVEHGIAQYQGLKEIVQDGLSVEFMILEFAEAAKLYVPLTRLDLIQKYRSTDAGPAPVLNRLGSQQWTKTKARVRKAMQDMAGELLKLYAERTTAQGTAFSKDNEFQKEFEDSFDYNETDDQLSAIRAIKYDMESTTPMDRLLCGDVGYGKTEVAMRAAFKAVQDGKQVAVLTPTTILELSALRDIQEEICAVSHQHRDDLALPHAEGTEGNRRAGGDGQGRHSDRHAPAAFERHQVPGSGPAGGG